MTGAVKNTSCATNHGGFFPDMTPDHVWQGVVLDSEETRARFVAHSVFDDARAKAEAALRERWEIR